MSLKNNLPDSLSENEVLDLLRFARAFCAEKLPWFSPALFKCKIHLTEKIQVAAIDYHFNVYFNPVAVSVIRQNKSKKQTLAQLGFLWIHEISHVLREHNIRAKERSAEPFLWNIACDMEINDGNWEGLEAPTDFPAIYPHTFGLHNGQLAEFYYQKLEKNQSKQTVLNWIAENSNFDENTPFDEGSGVHNQRRFWEIAANNPQQMEGIELELVKRNVAQQLQKVPNIGKIPGGWLRWANEKMTPKVDWRKVLRHRMSVAMNHGLGSRIDYSYARPSRRQAVYHPILTPSLRGDMSARVAVVVDTSGSMTPQQIGQAVAEICKVLQAFRVPVTVIPCDARAYAPIAIATPADYFKLEKLPGGGGTNMIVGIEAALALRPAPDSVLVLTDGYTPYPSQKYKTMVLYGILKMTAQQRVQYPPNPPWGKDAVVEIDLYK